MRSTNRHDIPIIAGVIYIPSFPETSGGKGRRKVRLQIESRDPSDAFSIVVRSRVRGICKLFGTKWNKWRIRRFPLGTRTCMSSYGRRDIPRTVGGSQVVEKPGNHVDPNGSLSLPSPSPRLFHTDWRCVPRFHLLSGARRRSAFHSGSILIITLLIRYQRTPFHRRGGKNRHAKIGCE